jgi:hypothetical protein
MIKPSHQTGEEIQLMGILRYDDLPVVNNSVAIQVDDPNNSTVISRTRNTNHEGAYNLGFKLSEAARLGTYLVHVSSSYLGEIAQNSTSFELGQGITVKKGTENYTIQVTSNASIQEFRGKPGNIRLTVSGETGTWGYVRIIQPVGLNSSNIKIFLNHSRLDFPSTDPPRSITTNGTHYFIYFAFRFNSVYVLSVQFSILGDITGEEVGVPDGRCDMRDVGFAARRFGISKPDPLWSDHADVTGPTPMIPDDTIDMRDIGLIARHFGEIWE